MDLQHVSKYWNYDAVIKIYINLLWEKNERYLLGDWAEVLGKYLFCSIIAVYKRCGFVQDFSLKYKHSQHFEGMEALLQVKTALPDMSQGK